MVHGVSDDEYALVQASPIVGFLRAMVNMLHCRNVHPHMVPGVNHDFFDEFIPQNSSRVTVYLFVNPQCLPSVLSLQPRADGSFCLGDSMDRVSRSTDSVAFQMWDDDKRLWVALDLTVSQFPDQNVLALLAV